MGAMEIIKLILGYFLIGLKWLLITDFVIILICVSLYNLGRLYYRLKERHRNK